MGIVARRISTGSGDVWSNQLFIAIILFTNLHRSSLFPTLATSGNRSRLLPDLQRDQWHRSDYSWPIPFACVLWCHRRNASLGRYTSSEKQSLTYLLANFGGTNRRYSGYPCVDLPRWIDNEQPRLHQCLSLGVLESILIEVEDQG